MPRAAGPLSRWAHRHAQWLFPAPAVLLVAVIIVYPIVYTGWMSLHEWFASSLTGPRFIGGANYSKILLGDPRFREAVLRTIYFTILAEAAHLDGATSWQAFWHITLPLLRPTLVVAILFRAIDALKTFDIIFVMTQGGPANATETVNLLLFNQAFSYFNMGYAASMAVALFALVLGASLILIKVRRTTTW